ncbi:MAG: hypothetical protein LBS90_00980 [Oscillospiraceae bacterium]|jgi:hypothetical protein|nr:hypothetical protein [Oscillospiraceae bacterium]
MIREFQADMNIIAALADEPSVEDGLSASALKAKFDEGGSAVKDYINGTLLPDIGDAIDAARGDAAAGVEAALLANGNMPSGGQTGDVLVKASGGDYDARFLPVSDAFSADGLPVSAEAAAAAGASAAMLNPVLAALAAGNVLPCSTAAATAAKTAASDTAAVAGRLYTVYFAEDNSAAAPTLALGAGAAYPVKVGGAAPAHPYFLGAGLRTLYFTGAAFDLANPVPRRRVSGSYFRTTTSADVKAITLGYKPELIMLYTNVYVPVSGSVTAFRVHVYPVKTDGTDVGVWTTLAAAPQSSNMSPLTADIMIAADGFSVRTYGGTQHENFWYAW